MLISFISFFITIILGKVLIPVLEKLKMNQQLNRYLTDIHKEKKNTPTMGGIIFIIPVVLIILTLLLFKKIDISINLISLLFIFISYGLIGLIDDLLIIIRKNNKGLLPNQKLILEIIVSIIFFYLFLLADNEPLLWIHTIGLKKNIGFMYGIFILLVLSASSNAVNLTDGLDGLATTTSIVAYLVFSKISANTGWLEGYIEISIFCNALVGSLLGFLVFNHKPAKIFMGDTGSLSLGATLGILSILTRHELLLLVIGIVFVIETLSVIIQVTFYKLFKIRIFKMTPIHHTFEITGMKEENIVILFLNIAIIGGILALMFI